MIVTEMHPAPISTDLIYVLVSAVTQEMVKIAPTLMSALQVLMTAIVMQPVRTTRDHFHVLAMRDIQEMELFA